MGMSSDTTTQTRTRAAAIAVGATGSIAAVALLGRMRLLRWGATDQEIAASQPGDELISDANVTATRAITVRRSPDVVWPWVAQLGQGRGGFYSYDFLENLVGCDIHSADRVVPEWQQLEVGDEVRLAPAAGLKVAIVEPGRALVLHGSLPIARRPRCLTRQAAGRFCPQNLSPELAASTAYSRKQLDDHFRRLMPSLRPPSTSL
jgi:hypothetical protein